MKSRKLLVQALAVAACTALVFTGGTVGVASAVSSSTTLTTSAPRDCNGSSAFKSIAYTVNGSAVSTLAGNVTQGATVVANFVLNSSCNNTAVGIASYNALSNHGNTQAFSAQTLFAFQDGTFSAGSSHSVSVVVPRCFFQVDFYTGAVAQPGNAYSPSGRLVSSDVGGTNSCASASGATTTTTVRPSTTSTTQVPETTTTTSAPPDNSTTSTSMRPGDTTTTVAGAGGTTTTQPGDTTVTVGGSTTTTVAPGESTTTTTANVAGTSITPTPTCASMLSGRVSSFTFSVNGTVVNLSSVKPGDVVTVSFTVAQGCREQLSLASYTATSLDTSPSGVLSQILFDSSTGLFVPGSYTMSVKIPTCMFQVDFVEGAVIQHFGPVGSNNFYAGRILDTAVGGTTTCNESTTTTTAQVGGLSQSTTTTRPVVTTTSLTPEVLGESLDVNGTSANVDNTTTTLPANVEAVSVSRPLATTGFDMVPILCFGFLLLGLGGGLLSTARRLNQPN